MKDNNDYFQVLNTINVWTSNCDTKVSIILATYGVLITSLLSSDIGLAIVEIIKKCVASHTVCNIVYLIMFIGAWSVLGFGLYKLVCVLIPKIDLSRNSIMFFGSVSKYKSFEEYLGEVKTYLNNDSKTQKDILFQIYAASSICDHKFKNQKTGLLLIIWSSIVIVLWLLIGFISFYL